MTEGVFMVEVVAVLVLLVGMLVVWRVAKALYE